MPGPYLTPEERRARNLAAIHRVPEGLRLVPPSATPPEPKEPPMTTLAASPPPRFRLTWPLVLVVLAAVALLGTLMLVPSGCRTVGQPVLQRVERTVDCLKGRLPEQAIGYLDVVTSCLVGGDYMACLAPLAEKAGRDVIACSVAQAGVEASSRAAGADGGLPNQSTIYAHSRAYLDADGAQVNIR